MSQVDTVSQVFQYAGAGFGGLWVETHEPHFFLDRLFAECDKRKYTVLSWDAADGLRANSFAHQLVTGDELKAGDTAKYPGALLAQVPQYHHVFSEAVGAKTDPPRPPEQHKTFLALLNFDHPTLLGNVPMYAQHLQNLAHLGRTNGLMTIVISPSASTMPACLQKDYAVLTHNLPDDRELSELLGTVAMGQFELQPEEQSDVVVAARGMTRTEAESAFALSAVQHKKIRADAVWDLKAGMIRKGGLMEIHSGSESFVDMGGLKNFKKFCAKLLKPGVPNKPTPRGLLLLGVPGAGKSQAAKCLASFVGRKLITLNLGNLFSKWQGDTDKNIRQALAAVDAMAPVILLCDEIDKQLAGSTGSSESDGGTGTRVFGTLLTWLNDHTSDVFFIGTCNDIRRIPAAFSRAERFDGVFFFDVPTPAARRQIWKLYLSKYGFTVSEMALDAYSKLSESWTGAEIKACCRLAASLEEPVEAAAAKIVPVAKTDRENLQALRKWASNQCLSVDGPGDLYSVETPALVSAPRRVTPRSNV